MNDAALSTQPPTEAETLLRGYKVSDNLNRFFGSGSFPNAHNNTPTKLGFAARMLRILRDYHHDAAQIFGVSAENLKLMILLQEAFPPLAVKGLPDFRVKHYQSTSKPPLSQFELSDDERVLCRALRVTIELFRRRFLVIKWGDEIREDENFAKSLELIRLKTNESRQIPITREDFFKISQIWFEMYAGARTKYAHPSESKMQSDLEFIFDHHKTKNQTGEQRRLFLSEGMTKSLLQIRDAYLNLDPEFNYEKFAQSKINSEKQEKK